jgi:hypothetical protein
VDPGRGIFHFTDDEILEFVLKEYGYGLPITRVNMNKGNGIFDIPEDCAGKISKPILSGWAVTFFAF